MNLIVVVFCTEGSRQNKERLPSIQRLLLKRCLAGQHAYFSICFTADSDILLLSEFWARLLKGQIAYPVDNCNFTSMIFQ